MTRAFVAACVVLGAACAVGGGWALAGLTVVGAIAAAARWPLRVVVGLVLYLPVEGFLLKMLPGTIGGLMSAAPEAILFVCAVSVLVWHGKRRLDHTAVVWLSVWLAAFVGLGFVSAHAADVPWLQAAYWLRTMVRYMPAAIVVGGLVGRREFVALIAPAFSASIFVQALFAVAEFVGGSGVRNFFAPGNVVVAGVQFVDYSRSVASGVAGTLGYYNNFALYAAMCFAIGVGALSSPQWADDVPYMRRRASRVRLLRGGVLAAVLCVLLAGSRQGIVIFLVLFAVMALLVGLKGIGGTTAVAGITCTALVALALLSPDLAGPLGWISERFGRVFSWADVSQSLQTDRLFALVRVAPAVLASNPMLGLGPGALYAGAGVATVAGALSLSSEGVAYVQDVGWVGLLVQLGLVGLLLMTSLFGWLCWRAKFATDTPWLHRGESAAVIGCLAVASLGMLASSVLLIRTTSFALWCIAGLCLRGRFAGNPETQTNDRSRT